LNCLEIRDPFDPTEDELREILPEEVLGREDEEEAGASILAHFAGGNAEESEGVFMREENANEDGNGDGNESEGIKKKSLCMHDVPLRTMRAVFASMIYIVCLHVCHFIFDCFTIYMQVSIQ
jgi:hypothetical protein